MHRSLSEMQNVAKMRMKRGDSKATSSNRPSEIRDWVTQHAHEFRAPVFGPVFMEVKDASDRVRTDEAVESTSLTV